MAIDFSVDAEFQEQLDWMRTFVDEEIEPLELFYDDMSAENWKKGTAPLKQQVRDRDVRHDFEERIRDERHLVDLAAHEVLHERRGTPLQCGRRFAERADLRAHAGLFGMRGDELADLVQEGGEILAAGLTRAGGIDGLRAA